MASYNTDIERLNYYEGEYLGAADFEAEQEYHRDMRRRHNLGPHIFGIVSGLDVAQVPNQLTTPAGLSEVNVYIQPGMAIDGFGREIVALAPTMLTQDIFAPYYSPNPNAPAQQMYLWISYNQMMLDPPSDACTAMNQPNAFGRVQEGFSLTVTLSSTGPTDDQIVINGVSMPPPQAYPPSPPPGAIVLPPDDSVPYQEFSTDDRSVDWYVPIGCVLWDPHNMVFVQQPNSACAANRQYVGVVASEILAPSSTLTIQERFAPAPLPTDTANPLSSGVAVTVVGSLTVDLLLNGVQQALIGGTYNPSNTTPLSPLTIIAAGTNEELIQFRNPAGQEKWLICENPNGNNPGLNIAEIASGGSAPGSSRLFIQTGGNVGIGTTSPQQNLSVNAGLNIDQAAQNSGKLSPGLSFGSNSGAGIASNQSGGGTNPNGLDFYTGGSAKMSVASNGFIGIGTASPATSLDVATGLLHVGGNTGTTPSVTAQGAYVGWNAMTGGTGETDFINNQGLGSGGFAFMNTPAAGNSLSTLMFLTGTGSLGIGTQNPSARLDVANGVLHVAGSTNPATTAQGAYLGWNALTGGTGETDFINNQGLGSGGFAFMNTPPSGSPRTTLLVITGAGSVGIGTSTPANTLDVRGAASTSGAFACGDNITVSGARTYLTGEDGAGNHWIMGGGTVEGKNNALALSYHGGSNKGTLTLGSNWTLVASQKVGYLADRFVNRGSRQFERGDVVVLHHSHAPHYASDTRVPLPEVQLTDKEADTCVCGIVDDPIANPSALGDVDLKALDGATVGIMVTVGAYAHCKVDADIAPIAVGDLLTTSPSRGYAQKLDSGAPAHPGAIIGKALAARKKGKGIVPVLVSHQ